MNILFEKIGGTDAIATAVEKFYQKVLVDDRIKHFFEGVDMERQAQHQRRFLAFAFGGEPDYSGRSMRIAHQRLVEEMGLNDDHFDAVVENLGETLKELGVPEELILEAANILESTRSEVLNKDI